MKKVEKEGKLKIQYLVLFFFLTGIYVRVSIDGFNLAHPGNLNSVDSFLHAIFTDWVITSQQILRAPGYFAFGYEDVVFFHPPQFYLIPAALSIWTGLESYNTVWLFAAVAGALPVLFLYIIGERIFKSPTIGILGSFLYILPLTNFSFPEGFLLYWIFPSYIGLWNVVLGKTLFAIQLWLIWELLEKPRRWVAFLLGVATGAQILSHIPETSLAMPLILIAFIKILKDNFRGNLEKLILFSVPAGSSFIMFLPKLSGVWIKTKPLVLENSSSVIKNLYFLKIFWSPILVLYVLGLSILFFKRQKYNYWLLINIYVLLFLGLLPLLFHNEEYFGKLRFLVPLVAFPVVSFGAITIVNFLADNAPQSLRSEEIKKVIILYFAMILFISGVPQYNVMKTTLSKAEMSPNKYNALLWLQQNTPLDSKILLVDGFNTASGLYSKRVTFQRDWSEYTEEIENFNGQADISRVFKGRWLEEFHNLPFETSFFSYGYHPIPENTVNSSLFDYVAMWDFSDKAEEYNNMMKSLLEMEGFEEVYEMEGITIMGRV